MVHEGVGAGGDAVALAAPPRPFDLYEVVRRHRQSRGRFTGEPIPPVVLHRVLTAAHGAPSVGVVQPWDFVLVTDREVRAAFHDHVREERWELATTLPHPIAERFAATETDGVLEASVSVVVTYDPARGAPHVAGSHAVTDAGLYSVCLAVENLWLASAAEGLGVGWVPCYRTWFVRSLLGLPRSIRPVAWLCIGPVRHEVPPADPADVGRRARERMQERLPLASVVHYEQWGHRPASATEEGAR